MRAVLHNSGPLASTPASRQASAQSPPTTKPARTTPPAHHPTLTPRRHRTRGALCRRCHRAGPHPRALGRGSQCGCARLRARRRRRRRGWWRLQAGSGGGRWSTVKSLLVEGWVLCSVCSEREPAKGNVAGLPEGGRRGRERALTLAAATGAPRRRRCEPWPCAPLEGVPGMSDGRGGMSDGRGGARSWGVGLRLPLVI